MKIYQLRIDLLDIKPPIWRRLLVPGSDSLNDLHYNIQTAFGWYDCHLHEFEIDGARYQSSEGLKFDSGFGEPATNEEKMQIQKVFKKDSMGMYIYDFGDFWRHKIKVEKITTSENSDFDAQVIGGKRACPPEDCGGPWGYANLLEILNDPKNPERKDYLDWLGIDDPSKEFDPDYFDTSELGEL
ncbi:MAG: plasmid pRiA4b ORF-3 family protein [Acidimicrobiales bacterium]|nr:plasmid pRiA4b ORF-3 family protein [Acidimicrobiales bacterium]